MQGSEAVVGVTKMEGRSAQKRGSSTADRWERTKGGAVMLERSPRMVAMDLALLVGEEESVVARQERSNCKRRGKGRGERKERNGKMYSKKVLQGRAVGGY